MIKLVKISLVVILASSMLVGADMYKKYNIESAKIDYKLTGSGNMMGVVTQSVGKKRVIFDNFGAKELIEENKVDKSIIAKKSTVDKVHKITYMNKSIIYMVDFNKKRVTRMQNPAIGMMGLSKDNTVQDAGKKMMLQMGGKKIGTDKVLGYKCDIWSMMGTKQCIHNGVILKVETDMMGIKSTEVATKIEFDISTNSDTFALPSFPIYDMEGNILSKDKLESMDNKDEVNVLNTSKDMALMKASMADAMANVGVAKGETPTKAQSQDILESMQKSMLPQMKEQILAQESILIFGKECLGKADTLKEANLCNQKANKMSNEEEEDFEEWNPEIKKEILGFISQGILQMDCIKKAKGMNEIQKCMPQE